MHDRVPASPLDLVGRPLFALAAGLLLVSSAAPASAQETDFEAVRAYVHDHRREAVSELVEFLRIPNVASDSVSIRRNAEHLREMMERRGIRTRLLETGGPPMVFGELTVDGAESTVLFYCHYDGQPVDAARWEGHAPFKPVLRDGALAEGAGIVPFPSEGEPYDRDWRIYARSASDDKSPIVALMVALDALRDQGLRPAANLKFLFEGDEETGSPHLENLLRERRELLAADLLVASDGPVHPSGAPTVFYGVRGITTAEATLYGAAEPLHSGHYGNWAPNPAERLAELIATMQDDRGRVTVDGWYADAEPLGELERRALARLPDDTAEMRRLAVTEPEGGGESRWERVTEPSLNVRGVRSGWVGDEARTVIPDVAVASFDFRLVAGIDPEDQYRRFVEHIRDEGYHVVREAPGPATRREHPKLVRVTGGGGYPATRTPMDHPAARALVDALRPAVGEELVQIPTLGGSLPMYHFPELLGTPFVGLPIVNPDNNQHSPNENLRLGHFFDGIVTLAAALRAAPGS